MPASIGCNLRVTGHCSQGGRPHMEDFFSVAYQQSLADEQDLEYAFIGIYDGHGGSEAATFAKENLINLIVHQKSFWSNDDQEVLRAIEQGYIDTHYAMWAEQEKWPKTATGLPSTAGTTASVAFIRHGKIYTGHVGDSGIVLGYQEDGEKIWRARELTQDHKPESKVEQDRIKKSGGKVLEKSGTHRVVWKRPKLGHKGPVRRNTPVDEIPFLAVARSLGDLWSYNSALGEFVVSPKPDVRVIKIDTKKFRCLIFGTDGLWNVVSSQLAVDNVFAAEQLNEHNISSGGQREWINPSKNLVDKALERWSCTRIRADNTSVVIIMLDPPGPPKRDVLLRASSTSPQQMEYLPNLMHPVDGQTTTTKSDATENFTMFDHKTNKLIDLDPIPAPTSGIAIMTRYENTNGVANNYDNSGERATIYNTMENVTANSTNTTALNYMNSFAESYSLLNSNIDSYGGFSRTETEYRIETHAASEHANQHQHHTDTYRLTKLETRTEQLHSQHEYLNESGAEVLVTAYTNYQDHDYVNQTVPSGSSLPSPGKELPVESSVSDTFPHGSFYENHRLMFSPDRNDVTVIENSSKSSDQSNGQASTSKHVTSNNSANSNAANAMEIDNEFDNSSDNDLAILDESIQINEISSSFDESRSNATDCQKSKLSSPQKLQSNKTIGDQIPDRKVTRSTTALLVNEAKVRRSQRNDQKLHQLRNRTPMKCKGLARKSIQNLKTTYSLLIKENTKNHKENLSLPRKDALHITKTTAITTTTNSPPANCGQRTRSTSSQNNNNNNNNTNNNIEDGKRTLRSQNTKLLRVLTIPQGGTSPTMMALRPNQIKSLNNKIRARQPIRNIIENVTVRNKRQKD